MVRIIKKEQNQRVKEMLSKARPREQEVLSLYYGFKGKELSFSEIGKLLNISRERAKQIKVAGVERLRRCKILL